VEAVDNENKAEIDNKIKNNWTFNKIFNLNKYVW
jgi:hypothetical protein